MFGTLIESRAQRQRRTGSSITSLVVHTAIIGTAVVMTARDSSGVERPKVEPKVVVYHVVEPELPKPLKTSNPMTQATVAAVPRALVLETPLTVPTEIPAPDMSKMPTDPGWGDKRVVSTGVVCDRDCPSVSRNVGNGGSEMWTANDVMMRLKDNPVPPRYPEMLRRAGIEGTVVVKFLVDTMGRVDMKSLEVVSSTHDAFLAAVRESLARLRFNPSMVGDRKIPAVAMMPFQFTIK